MRHYRANLLRQSLILLINTDVFGIGRVLRAFKDGVSELRDEVESGYRGLGGGGAIVGGVRGTFKLGRHVAQSLLFNTSKVKVSERVVRTKTRSEATILCTPVASLLVVRSACCYRSCS